MKKIFYLFFLKAILFQSQNQDFFCPLDLDSNNNLYAKNLGCPNTSTYWYDNNLYLPNQSGNEIYLKANFIFLTKPDGTGNFQENNTEHQEFIDDAIQKMNNRFLNLSSPTNPNCGSQSPFLSNTKIQIIVNKIWKVDPAWDFNVAGFEKGDNILTSSIYPPNSHYYYSYLDNDPSIPEGINIVFANDGDVYERLYVNEDYTTPLSLISQFAASQFPSTFDLNRPSRQFYPDVFNLYTYEKEIRYTSRNTTPQGAVEII